MSTVETFPSLKSPEKITPTRDSNEAEDDRPEPLICNDLLSSPK
jgi:hypothetical protein